MPLNSKKHLSGASTLAETCKKDDSIFIESGVGSVESFIVPTTRIHRLKSALTPHELISDNNSYEMRVSDDASKASNQSYLHNPVVQ